MIVMADGTRRVPATVRLKLLPSLNRDRVIVIRLNQAVKIWLAIVFGSALSVAVLWCTSLPLGIPGEWTWERGRFPNRICFGRS